jgi:hypothetical protein
MPCLLLFRFALARFVYMYIMRACANDLPVSYCPVPLFRLFSNIVKHELVMSITSRRHLPSPFAWRSFWLTKRRPNCHPG